MTNSNAESGSKIEQLSPMNSGYVPVQIRSGRFRSFNPDDFGAPTGREVNWMHTPVQKLSRFFATAGSNSAVQIAVSQPEYLVEPLAIGSSPRGEFFEPEDIVQAIAWQGTPLAPHIAIPAGVEVSEPIVVAITGLASGSRGDSHLVIEAGVNSRATVILRYSGSAELAENIEILVRDGAALTVISVQEWDNQAIHLSTHQATVGRSANLDHFVISFGGGIVRVNPTLELTGSGASGRMFGLSFADAGQHLESQIFLHHQGPHTTGDVLYKSALQGQGARSVWVGDVLIGREATGTTSYEANRNLILTEGARADSIPNLEIETGDILGAGHASATSRLDDEQLFYLMSRGITEEEALRLVVIGFLSDIIQRIDVPQLQDDLMKLVYAELEEVSV